MNKVLHINISGQVIAIEAPAYEALQAYLASLRAHFAGEEGCEEIINDIEGRIAEMLGAKIAAGAAAVTADDVHDVAAAMGHPADFAREAGEGATGAAAGQAASAPRPPSAGAPTPKRLYRDTKDRWLGGVCSGVANYLNADATLVRILFAVVTFGGFGLGFLIYLALWVLLPEKELEDTVTSRLFRNPDDKVIGGVASGLAAFFGKDPKWVRLILVAPLALNALLALLAWAIFIFGGDGTPALISSSFITTMVFAYVVMWVVLPEATTPYERMRMRGEPVDVKAIKQRVQAGLAVARQRLESAGNDLRRKSQQWQAHASAATPAWQRAAADDAEDAVYEPFAASATATAASAGRPSRAVAPSGLGHATRVIAQVILLSVAGVMAFTLFCVMFAVALGAAAWWWPARVYLWSSTYQEILVWATIALFCFVPAMALVLWLFRRGMGAPRRAALGWTFAGLWTLGWVSAMLLMVDVGRDLRAYEMVEQVVVAPAFDASDRLVVTASRPAPTYAGWWTDSKIEGLALSEQALQLGLVSLVVEPSPDAAFGVKLRRHSAGRSAADARARAERTQYEVTWQPGLLDINPVWTITPAEKFRGQRVEVVVAVPVGKRVRLDRAVEHELRSNQDYVMGADGVLLPVF